MSKMTRLIVVLLIVRAAAGQFFIEPGQAPPPPEPEPLASYSYEPLGWDVVPPGLRVRVTDDGLRVRAEPRLSAEVLEQLNTGDEVVIQSVGPREIIADRGAWWYEVAALDGGPILGWVYGGFLQPSQSGDWRDTLRSALGLVREGDPAAAHELLATLSDYTPIELLTEGHQPALGLLYNLSTDDDSRRPVYLVAGPDYGICLVTDSFGSGTSRVYDDRWLVWDSGTWVFGGLYIAELTSGRVSSLGMSERRVHRVGEGVFVTGVNYEYPFEHDPSELSGYEWCNQFWGVGGGGSYGVAMFYEGEFTLLLPEERYYCWREVTGAGCDVAGCYCDVLAFPNLDPDRVPVDIDKLSDWLIHRDFYLTGYEFRVRFDPEAGRVTGIEPLPSAAD